MYIDYIKNDYSDKPDNQRSDYINRDKKHLGGLIQERITNDIDNIVERWYELDDVGYISENEKFLYLLKEAEQLYCFSYYTGTIAIVGIASEEYCRYLIGKSNIQDVDKQRNRIDKLGESQIISDDQKTNLHKIRKIRNDCMHYNTSFKELSQNQLKAYALEILQLYKSCLAPLSSNLQTDYERIQNDLLTSRDRTFKDFLYRSRNIEKKVNNIDLQIDPRIKNLVFTSLYYVAEIDVDTSRFKEMTLIDIHRIGLPVIVDLTLPQVDSIKKMKIEEGNIIVATIFSTVTTLGQSEEWHLVNIQDIYREVIELNELSDFLYCL